MSLGLTNQSATLLRTLRPRAPCRRLPSSSSSPARRFSLASTLSRPTALPRKSTTAASRRAFSSTPTVQFQSTAAKMGNTDLVVPITSKAEFQEKVLESKGAVVVDCFATWCGPCKAIAPAVEKLAEATPAVKFYQIDVDELSDVAAELGVRAMPTFMFFKDGEKVEDVVGANPQALKVAVEKYTA